MRTAQAPCVSSCSQRRGGSERGCRQSPSGNHGGRAPPRACPSLEGLPHPELLLLLRADRPQVTQGGSPSPLPELEAAPAPSHLWVWPRGASLLSWASHKSPTSASVSLGN